MSRTSRTTRPTKGRILLVDDSDRCDALAVELDPPPLRSRNLFEAIGEITSAPANLPVSTVVVSTQALPPNGSRALEAIRRTDPSLMLFLIVVDDAHRKQIDAAREFCDHILHAPVNADELQQLIDADEPVGRIQPEPPIEAEHDGADETPSAATERADARSAEAPAIESPPPSPAAPDQEVPTAPEDEVVLEADRPEPQTMSRPAEPLGDVDLIHAAMTDPNGLLEAALELIRQQTGCDDIAFASDSAPVCTAPSIEVVAHQQRFGMLSMPGVECDELERWGNWLAQWLLLDHHYRNFRRLAFQDELTGAWNRRYFFKFLNETLRKAMEIRRPISVLVFDIDNFKRYNDEFGHEAGDVILIETVRLLKSEIRPCDRVCRIGGDEFAVIFADLDGPREIGSAHPETVEKIARRFQRQICEMKFPKLGLDAPGNLSISGGLASYPWDGSEPDSLLRHADQLSLHSKRQGKNVLTFGPGASYRCPPPEIHPLDELE